MNNRERVADLASGGVDYEDNCCCSDFDGVSAQCAVHIVVNRVDVERALAAAVSDATADFARLSYETWRSLMVDSAKQPNIPHWEALKPDVRALWERHALAARTPDGDAK